MVVILMKTQDLQLQEAIDTVGEMCIQSLNKFLKYKAMLPSWDARIDEDVSRFIRGLENWLIACLHWSFLSGRYFGEKGQEIKTSLTVGLLPPKSRTLLSKNWFVFIYHPIFQNIYTFSDTSVFLCIKNA